MTIICDQKECDFWSNMPANQVFYSMCLRDNLTDQTDWKKMDQDLKANNTVKRNKLKWKYGSTTTAWNSL